MYNNDLPQELLSVIGSEKIEFATKAKRYQSRTKTITMFIFASFWCGFISIFVVVFFGPLLMGEEVHFTSNGEPVVGSVENLRPMIVPGLVIGLFVLIGIGLMIAAFRGALKEGGYFVGTPTRFLKYSNGTINSYDWEQFSGNLETNFKKGDITFQLRTGKMVSRKNRSDQYVADSIELSGVDNVVEIESIARKRIKENDPTPVNAISDNV
ncbi:MAG: hypothetical protein ACO3E1_02330 [Flavobacteriales bacterium]